VLQAELDNPRSRCWSPPTLLPLSSHFCVAVQRKRGSHGKPSRRVHLSLCLTDVCKGMDSSSFVQGAAVPCVVRSIEDSGCVCDMGVSSVSGFLQLQDFQAAFGESSRPLPGQIIQVVVKQELRRGSNLLLSCSQSEVVAAMTQEFHGVTPSSLLPGQLVMVCAAWTCALTCGHRS
jgi:hypothetical protein